MMTHHYPIHTERGEGALRRCLDRCTARSAIRAPHHTASTASILGSIFVTENGWRFQPGELTLAGSGALILDDLPAFRRETVEAVGHALREGAVVLPLRGSRPTEWLRVPLLPVSVFATSTLCPCGSRPGARCTPGQIARFNKRWETFLKILRGETR